MLYEVYGTWQVSRGRMHVYDRRGGMDMLAGLRPHAWLKE